jgi:hypothetical protein
MVLGWSPFNIVSDSPALHSKWLLLLKIESSYSSHLEWRVELSDTILKGDYPRTIPARFSVIWFSGFRGEDLNVIFYQIMPISRPPFKMAAVTKNRNFFNYPLLF